MSRITFNRTIAVCMLAGGFAMAAAGFIAPPAGEISPSVLWFSAQAFVFAGSAIGLDVIIDCKFAKLDSDRSDKR